MKNPFLTESENKKLAHLWFEEDEAKRNEPKATLIGTCFRASWKPDGITDNRDEHEWNKLIYDVEMLPKTTKTISKID